MDTLRRDAMEKQRCKNKSLYNTSNNLVYNTECVKWLISKRKIVDWAEDTVPREREGGAEEGKARIESDVDTNQLEGEQRVR